MPRLLNLGCGSRFFRDSRWINIDFNSRHKGVISRDLQKGIPLGDQTVDVVYHSHFLEHFSKSDGLRLIRECFRVLRPSGITRIVVPDLEDICRAYLEGLEKALSGDVGWQDNYDWIMLEIYDQAVRTEPGGEMAKYLSQPDLSNKDFIIKRIGSVARDIMESGKPRSTWKQLMHKVLNVRAKGETHQWMYDRYSLRRLVEQAGFTDIRQCSAAESRIPDWSSYFLDVDRDGFMHAPCSLYMEGVKPG